MRRHLFDLLALLAIASVVAGYLLLTEPSWRSSVLRVYVFVLGGLAMLAIVAGAGDAVPRRRRSELSLALGAAEERHRRLPELERLEREVTLATAAAFDFHHRLLPQLREIAQARLERTGRAPGPDTLGRWWDVLRPDLPSPEDRFGKGIKLDELRELVAYLEKIGD